MCVLILHVKFCHKKKPLHVKSNFWLELMMERVLIITIYRNLNIIQYTAKLLQTRSVKITNDL